MAAKEPDDEKKDEFQRPKKKTKNKAEVVEKPAPQMKVRPNLKNKRSALEDEVN